MGAAEALRDPRPCGWSVLSSVRLFAAKLGFLLDGVSLSLRRGLASLSRRRVWHSLHWLAHHPCTTAYSCSLRARGIRCWTGRSLVLVVSRARESGALGPAEAPGAALDVVALGQVVARIGVVGAADDGPGGGVQAHDPVLSVI